jgi:hypothetical protein
MIYLSVHSKQGASFSETSCDLVIFLIHVDCHKAIRPQCDISTLKVGGTMSNVDHDAAAEVILQSDTPAHLNVVWEHPTITGARLLIGNRVQ